MKKLLFILVAFIVYLGYLQIWGGRDFSQIGIAIEKYQYSDDTDALTTDLSLIFSGGTISQGGLATAQMAERVYYRWTDENGVVQHSERRPNVTKYETIKMGDLSIGIRESLSQEEIKRVLKK
ncbi:MAG: hypothetical protein COB38_07440 [Gammaproteobacteria bacterium]|nr:MAG: hypothetical protein COB38_07440 [Gammaproteobacteria bacterium]